MQKAELSSGDCTDNPVGEEHAEGAGGQGLGLESHQVFTGQWKSGGLVRNIFLKTFPVLGKERLARAISPGVKREEKQKSSLRWERESRLGPAALE